MKYGIKETEMVHKKAGNYLIVTRFFVSQLGFEPRTPSLKGMCSTC